MKSLIAWLSTASVAALLLASVSFAQENPKPLTVEGIFAHGGMLGSPPRGLAWSPDGEHLTYLDGGELIDLDPGVKKPHVLVSHEKLSTLAAGSNLSEQDRDHRERYGMASYMWAPDSKHLMFDSDGRLWIYDLKNGTGVQIGYAGEGSGDDPKFSPSGEFVSFIHNHGLAIVPLRAAGTPTVMVAQSPNAWTLNGEVDWVYEEELDTRSNYFWSPDSRNLAFLQMIEDGVPKYPITDWIPMHSVVDEQRYPQPGDPNPDVRIGVVSAKGGRISWVHVPIEQGQDYVPRFGWVDRRTVWIETLSRDEKHRTIYFADPGTGVAHSVLEFSDEKFLNENYDVNVADGWIVLTSWGDGHNHIYLYRYDVGKPDSTNATLVKQLTKGDFEVGDVYRVDSARKEVYYASNENSPLDQQVWKVSFDGERTQLTTARGSHEADFSPVGGSFTDKFSSRMDPPTLELCGASANCTAFWTSHAIPDDALRNPAQLEVKAHDGTTLYATLLLPEKSEGAASIPLIVNPYGGPAVQTVANHWSDALLFDELLTQHGFAVLHADNRGMAMRGRDFAQSAYHNLGPVQLEDQLAVIDAVLAKYPQLDSKRLGWWGWSWGGTFTLYAMTHSDRFRAGVAVAPVTDWRSYDSIYTERYMSRPVDFPEGYKDFSVVNSAANLKGHLLLVHGTGDDNVHFENTVQFIQKLIDAQIPYDLQIYPRKTHSISGAEARTHLYTRILAHFEQYLKPPTQ
ncbi:MAG TPA: DPP IV N-terminal domain-containing protein [Terracidiphilus sp.]